MTLGEDLGRRLAAGEVLIIDGGMGSELSARGVPMQHAAWCGLANLNNQEVVRDAHRDFIQAGADIIITNTYPTARFSLAQAGAGDQTVEINRRAVEAAVQAREIAAADRPVYIAGSISSYGMWSAADSSEAVLADDFREQATILAESGVDLIALEMAHEDWASGLDAAVETGLPILLAPIVGERGDGELGPEWDPSVRAKGTLKEFLRDFDGPQVVAVTVMHTPVDVALKALDILAESSPKPYGAYPHWGDLDEQGDWVFEELSPEEFAAAGMEWVERGSLLVGGCCGIRPDQIAALTERVHAASSNA